MADINILEQITRVVIFFVPFLFALCFHEYAHGWVAKLKGDNTAEMMGRLTLNPFAHMDLLGTVVLPIAGLAMGGFVFGWAKPVPVNPRNLKDQKNDMFWIAVAGPLSNVLLGFVGVFVFVGLMHFGFMQGHEKMLRDMLQFFVIINLFLAVFNMIPVHPLDGGKVLARFLPDKWNYFLEQNQHQTNMIFTGLLLFMIMTGGTRYLMIPAYAMINVMERIAVAFFTLI